MSGRQTLCPDMPSSHCLCPSRVESTSPTASSVVSICSTFNRLTCSVDTFDGSDVLVWSLETRNPNAVQGPDFLLLVESRRNA